MKCKISLNNIKKIRKSKHITQTKLSIETGISQAEISYLENDKDTSAKLEQVEKIAEALHVCPFDLMNCDCKEGRQCRKDGKDDKCRECKRRKRRLIEERT
ncbi:helix-turn-helix domain-containing protein [Clostridium sardiniense]|uniref:helix-turn-helix domain-containing protein n=1 Tax=Clostridium sardiniense TaxID=29369 RepID=UPI001959BCEB|nr:helix-turn-helix transcriptional regulator [Clostridium sardiniense]MBM7836323.1 DNA-binding Xre family transcriptional regulator [Clostridium sardiniense]